MFFYHITLLITIRSPLIKLNQNYTKILKKKKKIGNKAYNCYI